MEISSLRRNTRLLFTEHHDFGIDTEFYMRNESLFFILVNNTKDDFEEWNKDKTQPPMEVNEVT